MRRLFGYFLNEDEEPDAPYTVGEGSVIVPKEAISTVSHEQKRLRNYLYLETNARGRHNTSLTKHLQQRELYGQTGQRQSSLLSQSLLPAKTPRVVVSRNSQIFCGIFSPDGSEFVTASQDRMIRIYDPNTWKFKNRIIAMEFGWSVLDVDYTGTHLVYCTWSSNLCLHTRDHEQQQLLPLAPHDRFGIFSVRFSPDYTKIVAGGSDERLHIFDLGSNSVEEVIEAHSAHVNAVNWVGPSNNLILSGSDDGTIKLWDRRELRNHLPSSIFVGHLDGISCLDSMKQGHYFLSNSKDQSLKVWDMRLGSEPLSVIPPPESYWDYRSGEESLRRHERELRSGKFCHRDDSSVLTLRGHSVFMTLIRARFSPVETTGQRYIYCGSAHYPFSVYVYDVVTGEIVKELTGHNGLVRDVSWNPNYPQIVSTSWDGHLIQWDV